jgi:hypothetical protein
MRAGIPYAYFVVTFAVTWSAWLAAATVSAPAARSLLFLVGTFAPGIVALSFTSWSEGRRGAAALLRPLVDWRVPPRWYVFALTFIAIVEVVTALLHRALTGSWPLFGVTPLYLMFASAVGSTAVGGQVGEELGWRGFALPRLTARYGLAGASLLLGVIWAVWHLPLFFVPEASTYDQSFPLYLLQVIALSVILAWLYASTGGSLVPVMLLHAAVNNTKDIVVSADPAATSPWALSHSLAAWLTLALLWLCAGYLLTRMRRGLTSPPSTW